MKMRIIIDREDGAKAEIQTGEYSTIDEVLKLLVIALQLEGYDYVKDLAHNAEEEIEELVKEIQGLNKLIDDLEERHD
jgi:hypothetical protein